MSKTRKRRDKASALGRERYCWRCGQNGHIARNCNRDVLPRSKRRKSSPGPYEPPRVRVVAPGVSGREL